MTPPPPSYRSSESVTRSTSSRDEVAAMAALMLESSASNSSSTTTSQSAAYSPPPAYRANAFVTTPPTTRCVSSPLVLAGTTTPSRPGRRHSSLSAASMSSASVSRSSSSQGALASLASTMLSSSALDKAGPKSLASTSAWLPSSARSDALNRRATTVNPPERRSATPLAHQPPSSRTSNNLALGTSAAESRLRLNQLRVDVGRASKSVPTRNTKGLFTARQQVKGIISDIQDAYLNESVVRLAVVAYRDHHSSPHIEKLDFTTSTTQIHRFLDQLEPVGGQDMPEDVLGGINQAINMSWQQQTRCLVHIGDAPGHGPDLHDYSAELDDFYQRGSEPHGLTYKPLIEKLIELRINYTMLAINAATDKMVMVFARIYAAAGMAPKLHPTNAYWEDMGPCKKQSGVGSPELVFAELLLGDDYSALRKLVVQSVTSSITNTASRLSITLGGGGKRRLHPRTGMTLEELTVINEDGDNESSTSVHLDKSPPQWHEPRWFDKTWELEGFCPSVVVYNHSTLGDMMASDEHIKLEFIQLSVRSRSTAFEQGGVRAAHYARTAASTNPYVVKSYLKKDQGLEHLAQDMQIQALCRAFALEFNGLIREYPPLDFVVTSGLHTMADGTVASSFMSLEPFLEGEYTKYNNNTLYAKEDTPDDHVNRLAQAFSHFTFERSWGDLMVVDLQGVGTQLTDPSIHTRDEQRFKLCVTNMYAEGFKCFFASHHCNSVCRELGLESDRSQAVTGNYKFREFWPGMDPTICCSNKLCQRIVRLADALEFHSFPGSRWCGSCWAQLDASIVGRVCPGPGPSHEFNVSSFFSESQGQSVPVKCAAHVDRDTSVSSAATAGSALWNQMAAKSQKRTSVSGSNW